MSRYRQQIARVRRDRAVVIAAERYTRPRRRIRAGEDMPADAEFGEQFDVVADLQDGLGERVLARVRVTTGRRWELLR